MGDKAPKDKNKKQKQKTTPPAKGVFLRQAGRQKMSRGGRIAPA